MYVCTHTAWSDNSRHPGLVETRGTLAGLRTNEHFDSLGSPVNFDHVTRDSNFCVTHSFESCCAPRRVLRPRWFTGGARRLLVRTNSTRGGIAALSL